MKKTLKCKRISRKTNENYFETRQFKQKSLNKNQFFREMFCSCAQAE